MKRTDDDTWDLASSVGVTATMVAAARALASREDNPLIDDPFAAPLVRAVGIEFFTRVLDGEVDLPTLDNSSSDAGTLVDLMAVRTRFFDDFFLEACRAGVRQAVILASGLDSRAYRLPWPAGMVVFEIDQNQVIEFKSQTLGDLGATPTADRRAVAVDLREDWPAALRAHGFDDSAPTAWSAEGLLVYLPPEAQDRLLDNITALSTPGSRIATEYHCDSASFTERTQSMSEKWRERGLDLNMSDLVYSGERNSVVDYLERLGWQVSALNREERFAQYGRRYPDGDVAQAMRNSLSIIAVRD